MFDSLAGVWHDVSGQLTMRVAGTGPPASPRFGSRRGRVGHRQGNRPVVAVTDPRTSRYDNSPGDPRLRGP